MDLNALIYTTFIDPLLSGPREAVIENIDTSSKVIDIACGPGKLALEIAKHGAQVTGIDMDEGLISFASSRARKMGLWNAVFDVRDASDLLIYHEREFDIAVISMAVHQFEWTFAIEILRKMKHIAGKVIIADYNCPMPKGFSRTIAFGIERIARGDHYRNFRNYIARGGIRWFANAAGLTIGSTQTRGNGVFLVAVCD